MDSVEPKSLGDFGLHGHHHATKVPVRVHDTFGFARRSARVNDKEWKVCLDWNHRFETEAACIRLYIYFLATSCKETSKEFI